MKDKKRFSTLKKIIRYISLVIVILVIVPIIYLKYVVRDIAPIDDSDMEIVLKEIPENENAYPFLILAQISYNDPITYDLLTKLNGYQSKIEKDGGLSPEKLEEALYFFEERFSIMDKAAAMPWSKGAEVFRPEDRIPNYLSMRNLANLRLERARSYVYEGKTEEAMNEALRVFKFGTRVSQNDGGSILISLMVGVAIKLSAVGFLDEIISEYGIPPGIEKEIVETLTEGYESQEAWVNTWKSEYRGLNYVLDEIEKGSRAGKTIMDDTGLVAPGFIQQFFYGMIFKTERVRKAFYDFHVLMIDDAKATDYSQVKPFAFENFKIGDVKIGQVQSIFDYPKLAAKGELGTYLFASMAIPNFPKAVEKRFFNDFLIDAMMLKAAALTFERDHGKLPDSLSELVPDYISEIPADKFSGKPMIYDSARGLLCSVSTDGHDDGCDSSIYVFDNLNWNEFRKEKDLVVLLH